MKRPSRLREAVVELESNYRALEQDFALFFPDLIRYTRILNLSRDEAAPAS